MKQLTKSQKIVWGILVAVGVLLFISAGAIVNLLTDFLWFRELRLLSVFQTTLFTKIGLGVVTGAIALLLIIINLFIAGRISSRSPSYETLTEKSQLVQILSSLPHLNQLLMFAGAVVSLFAGAWASNYWEIYCKHINAVPFGALDPLYDKDIAFYVFHLPYLHFIFNGAVIILLMSICAPLLVYMVRMNCVFDGRRLLVAPAARAHLLLLGGFLVLSMFFKYQLQLFDMVSTDGTLINGAGYTATKISIPLLGVMRYVAIIAAILVWVSAFRKDYMPIIVGLGLLAAGPLCNFLGKQAIQKFIVGPNELVKETPYINWSILNTRSAFELDQLESRHFSPTDDLSADALQKNSATVNNIRLWDQAPLLTTYSQLQEIRTYYEFLDVDNDRYQINGQYRQVMLSPRELVPSSLPSRIWINEHLTYTHGYGLCLGPVNSVTPEGLPDFFIKNLPPESSIPLKVTRPQIYYGEADAGYSIVKTGAKEFDYPSGNDNVYTVYDGKGGIQIGGLLKKLLFTLRFQELKILLRTDIGAGSRILIHRQIIERFHKAVPFLQCDSDPYMVICSDGRLVWMIDGYTTTDRYPYSAQVSGIGNYIRNSVKGVIDAYDGSVDLYIANTQDPIIQTYAKTFKGIFKPLSEMPKDLRSHIRYPQTFFSVQAHVYTLYHMTDPQVFYNKEDVWRIPDSYSENQAGPMKPYYTIMKLAGVGKEEEFILMVPFCPSKKDNMIAWLAARCDGDNYGSLLVFDFPKQKLVYGPSQIEARINQDPEISKQLTLWNQGGSRVIRGSLLVIPVEQSLLYVQPLYLSSQGGSQSSGVPELKRVLVAYENNIAMEPNLEGSLNRIFGSETTPAVEAQKASPTNKPQPETNQAKLISEANRQFQLAQEELKRGNWKGYGDAMNQVERLLGDLKKFAE